MVVFLALISSDLGPSDKLLVWLSLSSERESPGFLLHFFPGCFTVWRNDQGIRSQNHLRLLISVESALKLVTSKWWQILKQIE